LKQLEKDRSTMPSAVALKNVLNHSEKGELLLRDKRGITFVFSV